MKRYGRLFDMVFSEENIYQAYLDARNGKRGRRACFQFERHLGSNLTEIHKELHRGTYKPQPYFQFVVYEPKQRVIHAPTFRDVVVQHAIYRIIYNIFNRSFLRNSFACRIGYGTHKAAEYVRRAMRGYDGDLYFLKLDIRKFFYSIDRSILRTLIERKIKDKRLVDIMMMFAEVEGDIGIPIGNLLSQIYALIILNPVDHFIKRVLKVKHYARYVDDLVLIGFTRPECLHIRNTLSLLLQDTFHLNLSKTTIQKIRKGINFCGYRIWRSKVFVRKHSLYKFRKAVKKGAQESIVSILGHAKRTLSLIYMLRTIKEKNNNGENIQIPKGYRYIYDTLSC